MKLFIKKLILWPRNHDLPYREIEFSLNKINVITGESGTGKSTITSIIDYCLGSGKCAIPVGLIRQKCEWYGVLLQLEHSQMLLARHDPDGNQETSEMYWQEASAIKLPAVILGKNVSLDVVKARLNELAGIPKVDIGMGFGDASMPIYPSFRDMAAFNFQPQHIVANPYTLFFKTDTTQHREKLRTIFPFVLGSVTPEMLLQQRELKDLEKDFKRRQLEVDERIRAAETWIGNIEAYYIQARRLGLLPHGSDNRDGWSAARYLSELSTVSSFLAEHELPSLVPGAGEEYAAELEKVLSMEDELGKEVGDLTRRIGKMRELDSVLNSYQDSMAASGDRLSSAGWLRKRLKDACDCPVCSAHHDHGNAALEKLLSLADEYSNITRQICAVPSKLQVELEDVRRELRAKEDELSKVREKRKFLEDKNREQAGLRQRIRQIYTFVGRLEQAIESYKPDDRIREMQAKLVEVKNRMNNLKRAVNPYLIKKCFDGAIEGVSRVISRYAEELTLEHAEENALLDARELTVKFHGKNGRTDFLWEVGSGQNWVGYHLATLLAIHHYLLDNAKNPVPSFLVIDQPSQVYFPEASWGDDIDARPTASKSANISEDILGVRRIFKKLKTFLDEKPGAFQIIVTEHAGSITWEEVKDAIAVIGNWRGGQEDYLIPKSWM